MSLIDQVLARLRRADPVLRRAGLSGDLARQVSEQGIDFAAVGGPLQQRWQQALSELQQCLRPLTGSAEVLNEGGVYAGCWIESTGTISAEVLSRFAPATATATFSLFPEHQRDDGMIPYKVTAQEPGFSQIQIVTPLARSVWNHYSLHRSAPSGQDTSGAGKEWLWQMYRAMERYDHWLMTHRTTRGTGCIEAFSTFDTGHDLSPRFWFVPDRCYRGEATLCDPEAPTVPYLAPDLTANVICQRHYLSLIAAELGEDPQPWRDKAAHTLEALFEHCYDDADGLFYDIDAYGRQVRVNSDVLLRVLACEIGGTDFFTEALQRHVLRTEHFLSEYGFTSISLSDPRFNGDHTRNSWAGPVNLLTQIRAPHAFEHHGHPAELASAHKPLLGALAIADHFPQCIDPFSGEAGFTSVYSPAILWFLDAVERWFGILPLPDGTFSFTSLAPTRLDHGAAAEAVASSRTIDGVRVEFAADDTYAEVHRHGRPHLRFPRGWRVITDGAGTPEEVIGVAPGVVSGHLVLTEAQAETTLELSLAPNERVHLENMEVTSRTCPGYVPPRSG